MTAVHKEIMSRYHADGIFLNRWDGNGVCYCAHCVENFRAATGMELPQRPQVRIRPGARGSRGAAAADEPARCVEHDDPRHQSGSSMIPNSGSGALNRGCNWRSAGARRCWWPIDRRAWAGSAVADGQDGQGISRDLGRKPAVGLLGWAWKSRIAGRTASPATRRSAYGLWMPSPMGCVRGVANSPPRCTMSVGSRALRNSTCGRRRISATW